jgi:bis(5'-nucleosyl)-tetraphosphatase (symmetrical)
MSVYAIGDIQGCYKSFKALLKKLAFNPEKDELWLAGDLVNRGPQSLQCLRLARELNAKIVLGNHDLHLLACYYSKHSLRKKDTLTDIITAPDVADLMLWLRQQPLIRIDSDRSIVMTHAGIPHTWSIEEALSRAAEVEGVLRGQAIEHSQSKKKKSEQSSADDALQEYFDHMYGNEPDRWSEKLAGSERLRVITNYFTRMRFVSADGRLELTAKEGLERAPEGFQPWFSFPPEHKWTIVFGHWAAIEGYTGDARFQAIDTGCVWGGQLTALNLDSLERVSVPAQE